VTELPPFELGYPQTELRRQLVAAVLAGEKTATSGLWSEFMADGDDVPAAGDRFVLHDFDDRPSAIVEVTDAQRVPAREIDVAFARDEGEGFDPEKVSDPLNPQNLMKTSGRGIFYMKTFMDQVRYSFAPGGGTSLVMKKNLAKGTGVASSKI